MFIFAYVVNVYLFINLKPRNFFAMTCFIKLENKFANVLKFVIKYDHF